MNNVDKIKIKDLINLIKTNIKDTEAKRDLIKYLNLLLNDLK